MQLWHMFFSGALAFGCVRGGYVASINMSTESYMRAIVPIGALFAGAPNHIRSLAQRMQQRLLCCDKACCITNPMPRCVCWLRSAATASGP